MDRNRLAFPSSLVKIQFIIKQRRSPGPGYLWSLISMPSGFPTSKWVW
jgi:hypothetical protein